MNLVTYAGKKYTVFDSVQEMAKFYKDREDKPVVVMNWRDGQPGDYVVADDGGVIPVIKRYNMKHPQKGKQPHRGVIQTPYGRYLVRDHGLMDSDPTLHKKPSNFVPLNPWAERKSQNLNKTEKVFLTLVLTGKDFGPAYDTACRVTGKKLQKTEEGKQRGIKKIIQKNNFREMLMETAREAAESLGLTPKWVLQNLKDMATEETDNKIKRLILRDIGDAIGVYDKGVPMLPSRHFGGFGDEDIEEIDNHAVEQIGEGIDADRSSEYNNGEPV